MTNSDTFRVWVGCLGCYNGGHLIGYWLDADDAPQDMREWEDLAGDLPRLHYAEGHEGLWCFDTENSPVSGEMSPAQAMEYAEILEELEDYELEPFALWLKHTGDDMDVFSPDNFREAYCGEHGSMEDYAEHCVDDGIFGSIPDEIASYIDYEKLARDLGMDYWEEDGHIFRH